MAHIHRLIFAVLLVLFSSGASATIAASPRYCDPSNHCGSVSDIVSYWQSANPTNSCSGGTTVSLTWYSVNVTDSGFTVGKRANSACPGFTAVYDAWQFSANRSGSICPANSTISDSSCTCNFGFEESGGVCVRQDPCKRAHPEGGWHEEGGTCVKDYCGANEIRVNGACVPDPNMCPDGKTKKRADGSCPKPACDPDGPPRMILRSASMPSALCEDGCVFLKSNASACSEAAGGCSTAYYPTGSSCNTNNDSQPPKGPPDNPNGGDNGGDNNNNNNDKDNDGKGDNGDKTGSGGNLPSKPPDVNGNCGSGEYKSEGGCYPEKPPTKDPDSNGNCGPKYTKVNGVCVGNQPPNGVGRDPTKDPSTGNDTCGSGYYMSGKYCYPNKPITQCPSGQTMDSSGGCTGTPNGNGDCPPNFTKMGGVCVGNQPGKDGDNNKDFCQQNPDLSICRKGSFGGSCGSFQCDGDALQCAIAMDQHTRNCQLFNDESDESKLYGTEKGKTGNVTGNLPENSSQSIGQGNFDTSSAIGGGACIQDLNITVWRQSVTLPISKICPYLDAFGNILVAVSFLLAIRIVSRG
jgi:hypothetical protein